MEGMDAAAAAATVSDCEPDELDADTSDDSGDYSEGNDSDDTDNSELQSRTSDATVRSIPQSLSGLIDTFSVCNHLHKQICKVCT